MLKKIRIKNYILIEDISIDFNNCFSVLTGETGAGKSILIDALSLILGKRADAAVLLDKSQKCIVEATFDISKINIKYFFEENDLDFDDNTIIRREINSAGKSRAFINDTPVNLNEIKTLTSKLIDLHSQHENLSITDHKYRLGLIDSIAGTISLNAEYQRDYHTFTEEKSKLKTLTEKFNKARADIDYYKFQVEQIENLQLNDPEELTQLEEESAMLENAEEIKTELSRSYYLLGEEENSVEGMLKSIRASLNKISDSYKNAESLISRLESVIIELNDLGAEMSADEEKIEINPPLLEKHNQRIDAINSLLKKHNCANIAELLQVFQDYSDRITDTDELEEMIVKQETVLNKIEENLRKTAGELSDRRQQSFEKIEKAVISTLKGLGMPNANFSIKNQLSSELSTNGYDNIEFLFTANKNTELQILERVASGGELSRLMLTIKSMLAKGLELPTIIFDEIDTGVSGEIADKMASIMQLMAKERQVISITHLPQVAARGENHFKIIKNETGPKTITLVKKLMPEDRINEIASMISGAKTTPQAIENARILLS